MVTKIKNFIEGQNYIFRLLINRVTSLSAWVHGRIVPIWKYARKKIGKNKYKWKIIFL